MRRVLLLAAAIAVPVLVWAAASAPAGGLIEINHYDVPTSYIGADACAGKSSMRVEWSTPTSVAVTTANTLYKIYASNTSPTAMTGTDAGFCAETSNTSTGNNILADLVTSVNVASQVQQADLSAVDAVAKAKQSCTEGAVLYICSHYYTSAGRVAAAWGKFQVQVTPPSTPTVTSAGSGDGKLEVSWTIPTGGATVHHYLAEAYLPGHTPGTDAPDATSGDVTGTTGTIKGLTNGTTYTVDVIAYSIGGNPSPRSATATGTPQPSADFWRVYQDSGGAEKGGCSAGPGGAVALLGAASLLVLRRRRKS